MNDSPSGPCGINSIVTFCPTPDDRSAFASAVITQNFTPPPPPATFFTSPLNSNETFPPAKVNTPPATTPGDLLHLPAELQRDLPHGEGQHPPGHHPPPRQLGLD